MADRFELIGTIEALEQRRSRSGEMIPGFWAVRLRTPNGVRTVSFNSSIPVDWDNPRGERRPHPDFALLQQAMAEQKPVRIRGTVVEKGERTFLNGTRAERVEDPEGEATTSARPASGEKRTAATDIEDAKWAVTVAADAVSPEDADAVDEVREMAAALLLVAQELSEEGPEGMARDVTRPDNVHDLAAKQKRA
jgi:hypothetical protein